jgi:[protein-PII] uridylyltransferase
MNLLIGTSRQGMTPEPDAIHKRLLQEPAFASVRTELIGRCLSVESLLISTWRECFSPSDTLALLAVGGFGRAELFLHSDVDLLILTAEQVTAECTAQISHFQALAWQLKLDLAISVRSVSAAAGFAAEDLSFMTSLLDLRLLCGTSALADALAQRIASNQLWAPKDFFAAKLAEQSTRHQRFADTAYNNEPNLKEGPGGLRDLHTIRWVAQRQFSHGGPAPGWALLQQHGFISASERAALERAETTLSAVRQALHTQCKRKEERLLFDHQIALAQTFGFVDIAISNRAVEQLMQRYFRAVGSVMRLNSMLLARFAMRFQHDDYQIAGNSSNARGAVVWPDKRVNSQIVALGGELILRGGQLDLAQDAAPLTLTSACLFLARWQGVAQAGAVGARFLQALDVLLNAPEAHEARIDSDAQALQAFLSLLDAPTRVAEALSIAATHGLLGRLLPAFERVTGRMQYDLFHAYTVDQHTLFVLAKLEALRNAVPEDAQNASSEASFTLAFNVWARVQKPRLLFLAALFHDIAKGRGGDHSTLGAEEVRAFGARVGLAENQTELIAWLVEQHLTMSTTAQKRDIQDPAVVRQFATMVADRERLDHLYLLTVADIRGTNPKLWNGWKARLLQDLYSATRFVLRQGLELPVHASERVQTRQSEALELLRGEGAGRTQVLTLWQQFPEFAFLRHSAEELRFQTQAVLSAQRFGEPQVIALRPIPGAAALELFVRTPDRSGIFATIAVVLDRLNLSVLGARIGLSPPILHDGLSDGTPLLLTHDSFQLHDNEADTPHDTRNSVPRTTPRERCAQAHMALTLALREPQLKPRIGKRVATRQQRHFQFPAQIEVTEQAGRSVMALVCADRFGLLAMVAISFFEHRIRVHSARIATFGERVEDFFTLSTEDDQPLTPELAETVATAIRAKLALDTGAPRSSN